jgi:hypothetical protein
VLHLLRSAIGLAVHPSSTTIVAGEGLGVTVTVTARRDVDVSGGEVELVRTRTITRFRLAPSGVVPMRLPSSAVLHHVDLGLRGPMLPGRLTDRRATLGVPATGEATVAGQLVRQDYVVRARVRVPHGRDATSATPVDVLSPALGRAWVTGQSPVVEDAGSVVLEMEQLSSRRLSGGVPVSGIITVTPLRSVAARGIRADLVLVESAPDGTGDPLGEARDAETVVSSAPLAGALHLEPGRGLRLPFSLEVPGRLPAPSLSTAEFTLRWVLRAVLDCGPPALPRTSVELWATTTS